MATRKRGVIQGCAIAAALLLTGGAIAQEARAPSLTALRTVEPGRWRLHEIGTDGRDRAVCVADVQRFLQIRHPTNRCSRFVIDNSAQAATVHYTCPGAGHGRTTVTVESPQLIEIDTQGLADGLPFNLQVEARRIGAC